MALTNGKFTIGFRVLATPLPTLKFEQPSGRETRHAFMTAGKEQKSTVKVWTVPKSTSLTLENGEGRRNAP